MHKFCFVKNIRFQSPVKVDNTNQVQLKKIILIKLKKDYRFVDELFLRYSYNKDAKIK